MNDVLSYLQSKNINPKIESSGSELRIICPYCQNPKQKCYVHSGSGVFYCFHCGNHGSFKYLLEKIGNIKDYANIQFRKIDLETEPDLPPLDLELIEENHQRLFEHPVLLDWLHNHRGYTDQTIKKFKLGWDGRSICIPIRNFNGETINIKFRRDPTIPTGTKSMWGLEGRNGARLFNEEILKTKPKGVIIAEGEWDSMLLDQLGFPAVTSTAGAQTNFEKWVEAFDGIKTYICYDNDKNQAGQNGTQKVVNSFKKKGKELKIITLPDPKILEEKVDVTNYFVDKKFSKEDFKQLIRKVDGILPSEKLAFDDLMKILNDYWLNPDPNALRLVFSVLVAFKLDCDPLWVFLIAPPASLKTEFITGLNLIEDIYNLSKFTPQTLASGLKEKGKKNFSLLDKIKSKVLTFKDFTTILSGRWDALQEILGQLREVYDGKFVAEYGTGVKIDWKGKMGFLAGTTQKIDEHSTVSASLGERFIQYRMPGLEEIALAMRSINNASKSSKIREKVALLFKRFFESLEIPKTIDDISASQEILLKLAHLAAFAVRGRSGTSRDYQTKELTYIPDPEAPARLAQQLVILIKCLAIINGRKEVTVQEFETVVKVAFDCLPRQRLKTLNALFKVTGKKTTSAISEMTGYSTNSTKYFLEDMAAFGLTTVDKSGNPHVWDISEKTKKYLLAGFIELQAPKREFEAIYQWYLLQRNSQGCSVVVPCIEGGNEKINNNNRGNTTPYRVSVQKLEEPGDGSETQFKADLAQIEPEKTTIPEFTDFGSLGSIDESEDL